MSERPKSYIGFSGVVSPEQQKRLRDYCDEASIGGEISRVAYGVKATHKPQFLDIENKYGQEWYPVGEKAFAAALDREVGRLDDLRVAQVCFDEELVGDAGYRNEFTSRIQERGKAWLNCMQFDMLPWHKDEQMLTFLEDVKSETGHSIILQAHGESMRELSPENLVRRLGFYAGALDYIMFDASHGRGQRLDIEALRPFIDATFESDELSEAGVGIAGGLNAQVVRENLQPWTSWCYPDLSWDAEGQLHPVKEDGTRPLDMRLAKEYIEASVEARGVYT